MNVSYLYHFISYIYKVVSTTAVEDKPNQSDKFTHTSKSSIAEVRVVTLQTPSDSYMVLLQSYVASTFDQFFLLLVISIAVSVLFVVVFNIQIDLCQSVRFTSFIFVGFTFFFFLLFVNCLLYCARMNGNCAHDMCFTFFVWRVTPSVEFFKFYTCLNKTNCILRSRP